MILKKKKELIGMFLAALLLLTTPLVQAQDDVMVDEGEKVEEALPEGTAPAATEEVIEEVDTESNNAIPQNNAIPTSEESASSEDYDVEE